MLIANMRSGLLLVCGMSAFCAVGSSRQLTGAVYADNSGVSASGTGIVTLASGGSLVTVHYQKPIKHRFSSPRCWELGAVWTVWTELIDNEEELIRAECSGVMDVPVHSAWRATLDYIEATARRAGNELGFKGRREPVMVVMDGVDVDIAGYLDFPGNGMCLEVKERMSRSVVVIASSGCFLEPEVEFTVERSSNYGWGVTRVRAVSTR
jgi:hypothetical protein